MFTDAQTDKRAMENKVNSEDVLCFMLKRSKTNAIVDFTVKTEAVLFNLSQRIMFLTRLSVSPFYFFHKL